MKKSILLSVLIVAYAATANAQTLIWSKTSNPSSGGDVAFAITTYGTGIYVAGHDGSSGNSQWRIENRNMTTGDTIWTQVVSYVISGQPFGIVADSTGIYVAGYDNSLGNEQIRIEKRNLNTGDTIWTKTSNPSIGVDWAQDIAIDNTGIYTVGQDQSPGNTQWRIEKRDLATGDTIWTRTSNPSSGADAAEAVTVDNTGVYVAGQDDTPGNRQWRIEKRDLITGDTIWTKTSDLTPNNDVPFAIKLDTSGIYVAGRDYTGIPDGRWHIEKRELSTGDTIWTQTIDYSSSDDYVNDVAVDGTGIYLAGMDVSPGNSQFRIEKRSLITGDTIWTITENPSVEASFASIAIDADAIYVAGTDITPGNYQWRIEKYSQCITTSSFTQTATTICEGATINFTNTSISAITYQWLEDGILFSTATDTARTFNTAGTYTISLIADSASCSDSSGIVITVNPTYIIADTGVTICANDSALIYGNYQTVADTYYDSLLTVDGCDSIHSTVLTVNPTYNISDPAVEICTGDSALIYGTYRTTTGTYYDSLTTIDGCDSIHSTVLTVNLTYSASDPAVAICPGDSTLIYGTYRTTAGTYYDSLTTIDGCDSVHSTVLTINPTYSASDSPVSICNGDSSLIYGTYRTTAGTYYDSLTSVDGCDSIHSTVLTVNPTYSASDPAVAICPGDSTLIYGTYRTTAAIYYDSLTTANGCDSIHSTVLTNNPTYSISDPAVAICPGDSTLIYGIYRTTAGTYYNTLTTINGCDSTRSTVLTVVNSTYSTNTPDKYICSGDSVMIFGIYRSVSGIYYDSLTTVNGCDSVIITSLTVYVCTGVENIDFINSFKIYPNPNTGEFVIEMLVMNEVKELQIKITNLIGQEVFTQKLKDFKGKYEKRLDLKEYPVGVYNLQVQTGKEMITRQVIVE